MEELLAYAYLLGEELISTNQYKEKLDDSFLQNPEDENLLELELIDADIKTAIAYIKTHIDYASMNCEKFGKELFRLLKSVYLSMDIQSFGNTMFSLWESLAGNLQDQEPFWTLSYADDPLSWGDEKQTRKAYEEMLSYYDKGSCEFQPVK